MAILVVEVQHRLMQHRVQVVSIKRGEYRFCLKLGLLLEVQRFNLLKLLANLLTNSQERVRIDPTIALFRLRSTSLNT